MKRQEEPTVREGSGRGGFERMVIFTVAIVVTAISVNHTFGLDFLVGYVLIESTAVMLIIGLLIATAFLVMPLRPIGHSALSRAVDAGLALVSLAITAYLFVKADIIFEQGWEFAAPNDAKWIALAMWALCMECGRRAGGTPVFIVCLLLSAFPLVAAHLPSPFNGISQPLLDLAAYHVYGGESVFGLPSRTVATSLLGFIIFGVALQHTGAGAFFIDVAFALCGKYRGGPAKVAVVSSGLFGSLSGSAVANVMSTGTLTIPAMKRSGLSARMAGAVEACASTGGVLAPPVMGATAFVMASFLNVSYATIAIAATIPAFLYFFGMFVQIDAYAARTRLRGLDPSLMPEFRKVLREGWYYAAVIVALVLLILLTSLEEKAPYYATMLLLVINQFNPRHRLDLRGAANLVTGIGVALAELAAIVASIGFVIGALFVSGVIGSLTNDLLALAGGNVYALLLMGAATCFILGMGMPITASYIFLAILLVPALTRLGIDPLAAHMFLLYYGAVSYITPPVAIAALTAATISHSGPIQTGFEAMRIGAIIYIVPFVFVFHPALLMDAPASEILLAFATAVVGVTCVSCALQGYLPGAGVAAGLAEWPARALALAAGLLLVLPSGTISAGYGVWSSLLVAAAAYGLGVILLRLAGRGRQRAAAPTAPKPSPRKAS
ncbi:TRAP transporter permease [Nitratireductor alexandrii]|uniref:TRAP transporter permease n=1 Tax=Nitratireductor alexandrii TaxID=2448161 RepID=UPI000FDBDF7B|nr:TRAP transporter fused permease subunit [Nitratireductor alexandrii]